MDGSGGDQDAGPRAPECPLREQRSLGSVQTGADGLSPPIALTLGPHIRSVLLTAVADDSALWVTTHLLQGPEGRTLVPAGWYDDTESPMCLVCKNRVALAPAAHHALAPIAPVADLIDGEWTWQLFTTDPATGAPAAAGLELFATLTTAASLPTTGAVGLEVHLSGAGGITAESAGSHVDLQAALAEAAALLGAAGLETSVAGYYDLPAGFGTLEMDAVGALFSERVTAAETSPRVAVYVVDELLQNDGVVLAGFSPVPGPGGPATASGGVIVTVGAHRLGRTLAHELGHYLGLWHTFELVDSTIKDPLPDTAPAGHDNLMAPFNPGTELTAGQGEVIRRHPAVGFACP